MLDSKLHGRHPRPRIELIQRVVVVTLLQEGQIAGTGEVGLVVQQVEDAHGLAADHVDHGLVVGEGDGGPLDLLLGVLGL